MVCLTSHEGLDSYAEGIRKPVMVKAGGESCLERGEVHPVW